ncbi:Ig-like domain-containing protein [Actinoplanes sp. HUAS TT8]|uniref:Ig-like domain-containing protein n=1 Tax=Actinoplanes sp. HUAS TT8 TaxID=3447453 RepID=UPI003F51E598
MRASRRIAAAIVVPILLINPATPALADEPAGTTAPELYFTGLTPHQPLGRHVYFKPVFSDDVVRVSTEVDGHLDFVNATVARSRGVPVNLDTTPDDTDVDVTVRVYDATQHYAELTTTVHTEYTAPTATIAPADYTLLHGMATITASDLPDDVAAVVLRQGHEISRATAAPWELTWDTTTATRPATGSTSVMIDVIDRAGNTTTYQRYYRIDDEGPEVFPELSPPNVVSAGNFWFQPVLADESGVDHVEFWIDGALRSTSTAGFRYDFGQVSRRTTIEVRARDVNGYASTTDVPVTVDADGPTVTSITPGSNALVRGKYVTSVLSATDISGIQFAFPVNGETISGYRAPYTGRFPLGKDGKFTLEWSATDLWMHTTFVRRTVIVDNTRPTLKITSGPRSGAKVRGTVRIGASAADRNGVARVQLLINGKLVATDSRAGYAFSFNSAKYGKTIKIQLRAYDRAGNYVYTSARTIRR